jgi:hypothetical protein
MSQRYDLLSEFIRKKMRMSHVYQPVMLLELLRHRGVASKTEIAKGLLLRDAAQVEYYEEITRDMVGKVLTNKHGITERESDAYRLAGFNELSVAEIANLEAQCINKIEDYVAQRGDRIWAHRRKSSAPVPGTLRYEVLKRARFRCELCGISAEEKSTGGGPHRAAQRRRRKRRPEPADPLLLMQRHETRQGQHRLQGGRRQLRAPSKRLRVLRDADCPHRRRERALLRGAGPIPGHRPSFPGDPEASRCGLL